MAQHARRKMLAQDIGISSAPESSEIEPRDPRARHSPANALFCV